MAARIEHWIVRVHLPLLVIAAIATLVSTTALVTKGLKADYRLEAFVATHDESYERFRHLLEEFTSNEFALVAIHGAEPVGPKEVKLLGDISARLRRIPAVERCSSIADIPPLVRIALGDRLLSHPLLAGNLISEDQRTAAILCQMSAEALGGEQRRHSVARMKEIVASVRAANPNIEIILTGPYVTLIDMYAYVDQDLLVFSIAAFVLTAVSLWAVFQRLAPVLYAGSVGAAAILCTLGVAVALGVVTSLITQMIVILIIVLAVANCVHLAVGAEETDAIMPEATGGGRAIATLQRMQAPCAAVMLTTAAGFGSVCISEIAPVRRFGALMVFGLLLALVLALTGVVALQRGSRAAAVHRWHLGGLLARCAGAAVEHPWLVIGAFVAGSAAVAAGTPWLRFESDFVKNFRRGSEVRRNYRFIERNLSPLGSVELVVRAKAGDTVENAQLIQRADKLAAEVVRDNAMVKKSLTLADALTLVMPNVPATDADLKARLTLLHALPDGSRILRNFINDDHTALRLNFRCIEGYNVYQKLAACERIADEARRELGDRYTVEVTGLYYFYAKLVSNLLRDQYRAFALTLPAIAVVIWLLIRSLWLTIIAMIVNVLPVVLCLGAMGWADIPVNMTSAMMLSVAMGIAVDDTLHYLWRYRRELATCGDRTTAIRRAHASVGRACIFTTIVITGGFSILMLSHFLPTAYFGGLVGVTMVGALAADLLLLPTLLMVTQRCR